MEMNQLGAKAFAVVRNNKVAVIVGILVIAAAVLYQFKGWVIAATVDGQPITRFRVVQLLEKKSGKQALDSIVTQTLIQNEAAAKGITVTSDDIDQEVKKNEANIAAQGGTLVAALEQSGMTMEDLREQIKIQKELEKIIADKIQVSDQEVEQYITDNKVTLPKGSETDARNQIREQLKQQKLNQAASQLIQDLKAKAKINYYISY